MTVAMNSPNKSVSVVVPVFNEREVFPELLRRLRLVLESLGRPYEILFVDDGSSDGTLDLIREAAGLHRGIYYLSFSRNFGHQVAVSAGIENAQGDAVMVIDGDLQDPPELLPELAAKWEEGWEVVYAVRRSRREGWLLRLLYRGFYRILRAISEIPIPLDSGDFCLMDRRVVEVLKKMPERNRYVRGIRAWAGFRQTALPFDRDRRAAGEPKYSFAKLWRLAADGITSFSQFPLRLCGYMGYGMAFLSALGLIYSVASKLLNQRTPQGWTSLTLAVFFIGGVQLVMLSVVGAYVGRIYTEVQGRPLYVLKETNTVARRGEA